MRRLWSDSHVCSCCFCCLIRVFARHFTNQCLPIDFLIRREPKPVQRATHLSEACSTPQSTKSRTLNGLVRRRRRQQSGSYASSVHSASESTRSLDSASAAAFPPTLDDFERTIQQARASGVGRAFGYGTGGMVSGAGAVGISLGSMLRTRDTSMQRPSVMEATLEEDEQDDDDDGGDDQDDGEDDEGDALGVDSEDRFRPPILTPPIEPMSPAAQMDDPLSPVVMSPNLSPAQSDQTNNEAQPSHTDALSSPQLRAQNAATNETETAAIEPDAPAHES